MDEFDVILRARRLLNNVPLRTLPVPISAYFAAATAEINGLPLRLKKDHSLAPNEAGHTLEYKGTRFIVVNGNDLAERQRFTACHELAHIVLGLPTEHHDAPAQDGFARRSANEVLCDVFAAEILLPFKLLKDRVADTDISFDAIDEIAIDFEASRTATGSRFASVCDRPCAFVLAQGGLVRYSSRSTSLREVGGWVRPGTGIPDFSLAGHLRRGSRVDGPLEIPAADWLDDWQRGGFLLEDARQLDRWDQTLSLLWFDDDCVPTRPAEDEGDNDEEEAALRPLDGVLPWPGRHRRKR